MNNNSSNTTFCNVCAPVVQLKRATMPAPAFTDFSKIFICEEVSMDEQSVLLKHEQAHIWLHHNHRKCPDGVANEMWRAALELEIARNIYTEKDDAIINRPFSFIKDGYTRNTYPDIPEDIIFAEDIYEWLKQNKKENEANSCATTALIEAINEELGKQQQQQPQGEGSGSGSPDTTDNVAGKLTKEELESVKEDLENLVQQAKQEQLIKNSRKNDNSYANIKPTLASEIDYILRVAFTRKATYARPTRKQDTPYILKGSKRVRKAPRVEIFIDRSGSFSGERTRLSEEKINSILAKYRARLNADVFYFSDNSLHTKDVGAGGNTPYHLIMEHLEKSRPLIAVVLTDDDNATGCQPLSHKNTKIYCVPIGVNRTHLASVVGGVDLLS